MATVNYLYRSIKPNSNLTLRLLFRHKSKDHVFSTRTKVSVDKEYWKKMHFTNRRDASIKIKRKEVNDLLLPLESHVLKAFNQINPEEVNKFWLTKIVSEYHNPKDLEINTKVAYWINKVISTAHTRDNSKGGIGLSKSRITSYKRLLFLFKEFQGSKNYNVEELNKNVFDAFRKWLLDINSYSPTYSLKKLSDLKTICREARSNGVSVSNDLNDIKTRQVSAYDDDMDVIYLTEPEITKIENCILNKEALINARKWLILACYTGQRGETLLKRISKDNFEAKGKDYVIKVVQKKGNKSVQIPVLPKVREIFENGFPYPISTQKLNIHLKEIGRLSGLNDMVMGRIIDSNKRRGVKKLRPKWQYLSSHIGRRTFATNHYRTIPTPVIMRVTGHSKESTFLKYINQSDDSHIDTFLEYYSKKELMMRKEPQLQIIKKANP